MTGFDLVGMIGQLFRHVSPRRYATSIHRERVWDLPWFAADPGRNAFDWDDDEAARLTELVVPMVPPIGAERMARFRFIDEVTVLLVSRYGRWACGWDFSNHDGGPVEAWCCDSHSVGEMEETAERVVTCLLEWRDWLEDMAERFEQLAPLPGADAEDRSWHLERAVTRLVTAVVNSTHAESSWYGICETTLTWFLTSTGMGQEEARKAVGAAIGGRFKSHVAPAPTLVDTVGEDLAIRLTGRGFYRER
ncbi:hypothetical protein GCM10018781_02120 [Kitasatospora indigofera]|uniref:Uncharacterized protein n=1 Tax=Kitasatospora indigofera TaxID=67307 RepID=A0A919FAT0_9ACTN|nr:hypothetical protein [Kitasatospora indigofera]GHH59247.1 hypothetical protein GCM10018781_02120 [Kitasatospora indigofera]